MTIKILQIGNVGTAYTLTKELRKIGIESDLMVEKNQIYGNLTSVNYPLKFDSELTSLPDWIQVYDIKQKKSRLEIIRIMRKYDLIHAYMGTPIHAMFSAKPYVAHSVGDDLRVTAFKNSIKGYLLRKAYRKSKAFIYEWVPHKPFVEKLRLKNAVFIPKPWNVSNFDGKKIKKVESPKLVIFHPLGQDWNWKGNDKFLRAFVKLCKEEDNIFLYYVDWGKDSKRALKILDNPYVAEKIEIIKGPISRQDMVSYMNKSDILADQFNSGSFTRTGIEAMVFGIPLLVNLDEQQHFELFGSIPSVINVKNEEGIITKLKKLISSKNELEKISKTTQDWVTKNYNLKENLKKYFEIYEKILGKNLT